MSVFHSIHANLRSPMVIFFMQNWPIKNFISIFLKNNIFLGHENVACQILGTIESKIKWNIFHISDTVDPKRLFALRNKVDFVLSTTKKLSFRRILSVIIGKYFLPQISFSTLCSIV